MGADNSGTNLFEPQRARGPVLAPQGGGTASPAAVKAADFRNTALLDTCLTESGKILPRRRTGFSAKDQRALVRYMQLCLSSAHVSRYPPPPGRRFLALVDLPITIPGSPSDGESITRVPLQAGSGMCVHVHIKTKVYRKNRSAADRGHCHRILAHSTLLLGQTLSNASSSMEL